MDIDNYIQKLDENTHEATHLADGKTLEDLVTKKEGSWNALEIFEHILLTERLIISFLLKPSPARSQSHENFGFEKLNRLIVNLRGKKIVAPEMLHPKGEINDSLAFNNVFLKQRGLLKQSLVSGRIVIDNGVHKHPFLGEMTISDWLNFIPLHTRRHLDQIRDLLPEIKKEL